MIKLLRATCALIAGMVLWLRSDIKSQDMFSWSPEGWEHDQLDATRVSETDKSRREAVRD